MDWSLIIGIFVSVFLYLLADRKTLGAKKERANIIYEEILKSLFKRIVHENYIPSKDEINRIISTKCLENKLKIAQVPSPIDFINSVYTKVMMDEVLEGDKKTQISKKINDYLDKMYENGYKYKEEYDPEDVDSDSWFRYLLMFSSSSIAVFFTFFITMNNASIFDKSTLFTLLFTFVGGISSIFFLTYIRSFKEDVTEVNTNVKNIKTYRSLEEDIEKSMKNLHYDIERPLKTKEGYLSSDYMFKIGNKNYFVEIKSINNFTNKNSIKNLVERGKLIKEQNKNNTTILVVNNKQYLESYINKLYIGWDRILDLREFKSFRNNIVHKKKNN